MLQISIVMLSYYKSGDEFERVGEQESSRDLNCDQSKSLAGRRFDENFIVPIETPKTEAIGK